MVTHKTAFKAKIIGDEPCPQCRANGRDKTGNHLMIFDNGTKYCNRCGYRVNSEEDNEVMDVDINYVGSLPIRGFQERKIRRDVCERFGVRVSVSQTNGEINKHYYPITKKGKVIGYKVRELPKKFSVLGDSKECDLFGQSVASKNKKLLIVGGELDCLSAYQMLKDSYPAIDPAVVSLPKGENLSGIKENLDWINSFTEVIIYTDMDEVGRTVADNLAKLIGHKAKIMETSEKDASDMLVNSKAKEFVSEYFAAKTRKPEGIVSGTDISLSDLKITPVHAYDLPYPELNRMMGGLRKGELTTLTAGSGVGKSTLAREIGYHLRSAHDLTVGNIFLEETLEKTATGYIAIDNNVSLSSLRKDPHRITELEWQSSYDRLIANKWFGLKHFGSLPTEDLLDKMRYLAYGENCDFIILDHLSMVFSGQSSQNERKDIDLAMTELAAFVNESGVGLIVVVHLSRNKAKTSFNEGGQISLNDLRGSAALEQLSWNVLALERNQQDEEKKNESTIRVLKQRETGWTGEADTCVYNFKTGRLLPIAGENDGKETTY